MRADARSKIGNVPVEGRNLLGENLACVPAECLCHCFQTAHCKYPMVLSRMNHQVNVCASSSVEEKVGERGMNDLYNAVAGLRERYDGVE